jgi:transcription antitermination protein NusB
MFNVKTISRIAAIQTLYQYDMNEKTQDINLVAQKILEFYQNYELYDERANSGNKKTKVKLNTNYFMDLVKYSTQHLAEIDKIITSNLDHDRIIEDISPLLLVTLRIAVCEINFFKDVPRKVIINEFTNIASEMLNDSEVGFVNFMLDKISMSSDGSPKIT